MKKVLVGAALMFSFVIAKAQTADEIVAKYVTAIGGKDNIDKIKNVVMEGSVSVQGNTVNVTVTKVQGKLFRQDISMMGMNGFSFVTDTAGYAFMPFMGQQKAEAMSGDQVKGGQSNLDVIGPLNYYQSHGATFTLAGDEDVAGIKCFVLKTTDSVTKNTTSFYVDKTTYLLSRIKQPQEMMGQKMDISVDFGDYKDVQGVKMPFSLSQQFGNITFSSIKANTDIDAKLYKAE